MLLTTERLILRPLEMADAEFIQKLLPEPSIVRNLQHVPWPYPCDGAIQYLNRQLPEVQQGNRWMWSLRSRLHPEQGIGVIEYGRNQADPRQANRGFWLGVDYQGYGYMTEAVNATLTFMFQQTDITCISMANRLDNAGSRRVKEKTGAILVGQATTRYQDGDQPEQRWKLTKQDWAMAQDR